MSGFFGEWDIEGAADDPFSLPVGTYHGNITDFDGDIGGSKKDGGGEYRGIQWTLTVSEGPNAQGTFPAYFPLPVETDTERVVGIKRASIKKFLAGLEIPIDRMNTLDPNETIGLEVIWTVTETKSRKTGKTFMNLGTVRLANGSPIQTSPSMESLDVFAPDVDKDEFGM